MTKTKRNLLINSLQHFLSYLMSPTLMENGKNSEDKELYLRQVESGGKVGFSTLKIAPLESIHPRKRIRLSIFQAQVSTSQSQPTHDTVSESLPETPKPTSSSASSSPERTPKYKRASTTTASLLVLKNNISTHKANKVLATIAEQGHDVTVPSQSGVWRRTISEGQKMKTKVFEKLQSKDPYCLHFDGKRIQGEEYQVVLLKNTTTEIKLGILKCENGSATAIHKELQLIDEYDAWENIRMIICDMAAVNTGRLNGIVTLIQDDVLRKGFQKPQYIGCQHHVLDLLLKHVMNFLVPESKKKPELNYFFIDKLTENYASLQIDYHQVATDDVNTGENPGWRDDFKFLYELCQAYRHYKTTSRWPRISWKKLPNLHMARWNSRAVYAVIAFFLIPEWRRVLGIACNFICYEWANAWFQSQHYNEASFNELLTSLTKTKCKKAIKCLKAHWLVEESLIDIPRSNQNAERPVKLMEELHAKSKKN
ncbi:N-terminal Xaa-Pro-Lys N-methyltransferase 2 isoform X1 [Dendrobates tinctorius]|uniref:N-terminal Xaa-Pro-Lys N-methyltransferase 2 isoform X1 n=1 Tax=Dendrobates tinctorius TaxID=92724 RepID=UPI003CC93880